MNNIFMIALVTDAMLIFGYLYSVIVKYGRTRSIMLVYINLFYSDAFTQLFD